jgi:hypothetical protein
MAACRRCSECATSSHHWIEDWDPATQTEFGCKHCGLRGVACPDCGGDGCGVNGDDAPLCEQCQGEGVLPAHEGN